MIEIEREGLRILEFSKLAGLAGLRHGVFTRLGGVSLAPYDSLNAALHVGDDSVAVLENRARIARAMGAGLESLCSMRQVHGVTVGLIGSAEVGRGARSWEEALPETDSLISNQPGALLMALVADCTAVVLYDPVRRAVGVAHGGWRGTLDRIGRGTVERMREAFGSDPADLVVGISPSIGSCCYPVGAEIAESFRESFPGVPGLVEGDRLDVTRAMVAQLREAGVRAEAIETAGMCTSCGVELFYSYRKEERTGRIAVVAGV